jgi:hypothetical protein
MVMLIVNVVNAKFVNSLGANDPRYVHMAQEFVYSEPKYEGILSTNSFHILDLHAGIPSRSVSDLNTIGEGDYFLLITEPSYDAIATIISPVPIPKKDFVTIKTYPFGYLLRKSEGFLLAK